MDKRLNPFRCGMVAPAGRADHSLPFRLREGPAKRNVGKGHPLPSPLPQAEGEPRLPRSQPDTRPG